jgi:hypothetical protein
MLYGKQIIYSKSKVQAMWRVIKNELQRKPNKVNIHSLSIEGKNTSKLNALANTLNKFY